MTTYSFSYADSSGDFEAIHVWQKLFVKTFAKKNIVKNQQERRGKKLLLELSIFSVPIFADDNTLHAEDC